MQCRRAKELSWIVAFSLLPWASVLAQPYQLEVLPGPANPRGNQISPRAINNRGAIAGFIQYGVIDPRSGRPNGATRGFKRNADGVYIFPFIGPGDTNLLTIVTGLNELGMMCGWNYYGVNQTHGFLFDGDKFTIVDLMPSGSTLVGAINNLNHYAGSYGAQGGEYAFIVVDGKLTQFSVPSAEVTHVNGLAWDDTAVGDTYLNGHLLGYLRGPKGRIRIFDIPGAQGVQPMAINNKVGLIVGNYRDSQNKQRGFVYNYLNDAVPGPIIPISNIDYPGAFVTSVTSVNADGTIVGYAQPLDDQGSFLPPVAFIGRPQ